MNRRSPFVLMSFAVVALMLSGCSACKQTGTITVHTFARTDAKGPWANSILVINGQGFAPNERFDIGFHGLPSATAQSTSWTAKKRLAAVTDANGSFSWSLPLVAQNSSISSYSHAMASLPPLDYYADPNQEVTITATESGWLRLTAACTSQATIKASELLGASLNGAPALADTAKAAAK